MDEGEKGCYKRRTTKAFKQKMLESAVGSFTDQLSETETNTGDEP
jgi:hypothetical protein